MRWMYKLSLRLRSLFRKSRAEHELTHELRFHLEKLKEEKIAKGISPEEAHFDALRELGGVDQIKEECRDMRRVNYIQNFMQDVRYGLRVLGKSPGLTAIIVVTLALGIGANTAIFGIVNSCMLRPLPVPEPEQITVLAIQQKDAPIGSSGFAYPEFVDFRERASMFSDVFAVVLSTVQLSAGDRSEQCFANYVSKGFFTALGVKPAAGRLLLPNEGEMPGEPALAVLGYSYWQKRFHGDVGVVGQQIRINRRPATIIGVVPKEFQGVYSIFEMDVYLPLRSISMEESQSIFWNNRDRRRMLAFGRLKPGVSLRQAQSSLDIITARLASQYPATDKWFTVRAVPEKLARPIPYANNAFVAISGLFLVLALFVLLLACMTVENILLARGAVRQREMAIRSALGGGRARMIAQMLTENMILALIGGAAGMLLAVWVDRLASSFHLKNIPLHLSATFDWRVFVFGMGCALFTGAAVGLLPALRASSADPNSMLHNGSRRISPGVRRVGLRDFLVIAQVAGSYALLVAAGLFVRSLQTAQGFNLGFDPNHVLNVIMDPQEIGYDEARTAAFYREIESRVGALPGVQSVSLASYVPMGGWPSNAPVWIEGLSIPSGQQSPRVLFNSVDPPFFATLRVPLLRGRDFSDSDNKAAPPVAIINQTMARRFWPHEDPIGKRFSMASDKGPFLEVVGVTGEGKYQTVGEDAQSFFYVPLAQSFASRRALQIRTFVPPESLAAAVKEQIRVLTPELSIMDIETMSQALEGAFGFFAFRVAATLAAALGIIGLILAVVGVYGIVSFTASQRTNEIGIRMALGANVRDVLNLVLSQGVRLVVGGVVIGMITAWALTRSMIHLLVGIRAADPVTFVSVAILLSVVGLLACYIPARRATKVDPMVALRHE